jgi:flagellar motor switch protein FliG
MPATNALPGVRKAALLMLILGEDAAGEIYRQLPPADAERISQEIASLDPVDASTALLVLEEFDHMLVAGDSLTQGGKDDANELPVNTFSEEHSKPFPQRTFHAREIETNKLDSLQTIHPQRLARLIQGEHPQTIALILAHFDARQASALMMCLPELSRAEVIKRLAHLRQFSPEMAQRVSLVLHKRLQATGEQSRLSYAGLHGVADLMNRLEVAAQKNILEAIEREDSKLALSIRNLMFTFEDLLAVPQPGIRELLAQMDKKTLATALRGASEELKTYIFQAMSSRAADMLKEDMEVLGPVKSRDIAKAQLEAVSVARRLETEGRLSLTPEDDDEYVA